MDQILLTGMNFYGHHGCSEEERQRGQNFYIDAELNLNLSKAGKSDLITNTVDYVDVYNEIKKIVTGKPKNLIETVAEEIAETLFAKFYLIETIKITIHKPSAPIDKDFTGAAISITRSRD